MTRRVLAFFLLSGFALFPLFAQRIESFGSLSGRALAMGGFHVALADDQSVLLANPAGLYAVPRTISYARLNFLLSGPLFDMADLALAGADPNSALSSLLEKNNYKLFAGVAPAGPLGFSMLWKGQGIGVFNDSFLFVDAASMTNIQVKAGEDFLLIGGRAFRVKLGGKHVLDFGFNGKAFIRGAWRTEKTAFELDSLLGDPASLFAAEPFEFSMGLGVDLGIRWSWDEQVALAIVCKDPYSPIWVSSYANTSAFIDDFSAGVEAGSYATVHPDLGVGFMWKPKLGRYLSRYLDGLTFALDYSDIVGLFDPISRHPILGASFGFEMRVLGIVSFRAGLRDALPSAGIGLALGLFKLDIAVYGKELGIEPGENPVYNLMVGFDFTY